MSIDTDSDHVSSYDDIVRRALQCNAACNVLYLTGYYYYGRPVLIVLSMEEDEEMVERH